MTAAGHLDHLAAEEAVLYEGGGEALVGAAIAQLAVSVVAPAVQFPGLCVCCNQNVIAVVLWTLT